MFGFLRRSVVVLLLLFAVGIAYAEDLTVQSVFHDPKTRALSDAAEKANLAEINSLLSEGVLIDSTGEYGFTPLAWVLFKGNKDGFEHLLKKGASPNARLGGNFKSILFGATKMKDPFFLETALKYGGDPNQTIPMFSWEEPLFWFAITNKRLENLKTLLEYGVDVNATEHNGKTIISCAAGLGQFDMVYLLLERGARYSVERKYGTLVERLENRAVHPDDRQYAWRNKVLELLSVQGVEVIPCEWSKETAPKITNIEVEGSNPRANQ